MTLLGGVVITLVTFFLSVQPKMRQNAVTFGSLDHYERYEYKTNMTIAIPTTGEVVRISIL